jgi:hypothetical protein
MRAVELAEMLRELLEEKINKCKREIRFECTMPTEEDRLQAQIMAYQWIQARKYFAILLSVKMEHLFEIMHRKWNI